MKRNYISIKRFSVRVFSVHIQITMTHYLHEAKYIISDMLSRYKRNLINISRNYRKNEKLCRLEDCLK